MSLFSKKHRREDLTMVKRVTHDARLRHRLNLRPLLWDGALYLLLAVALSAVAFYGRPPYTPAVQVNQIPKFSYEAPFDFSYESKIRLKNRQDAARQATLPVFRINTDTLDARLARLREFSKELGATFDLLRELPEVERVRRITEMPAFLALSGVMPVRAKTASRIVAYADSAAYLELLFNDGLRHLENHQRAGLYDDTTFGNEVDAAAGIVGVLRGNSARNHLHVYEAARKLGSSLHYQAVGDADTLVAKSRANELARAVTEFLGDTLAANIELDQTRTKANSDAAVASVRPEQELVRAGTTLIQRDVEVTPVALERWRAFRTQLAGREKMDYGLTHTIVRNTLVGLGILGIVILFTRTVPSPEPRRKRALTLVALTVTANLALLRLGVEFSDTALAARLGGESLVWGGVFVLAPLLCAILAGTHMAVVATVLVGGYAATMHGNSIEILLAVVLASLVAIRGVRAVRLRSRVIASGLVSAIPVALVGWYQCASDHAAADAPRIALLAALSGLGSGLLAAALLPYLEKLFRSTTDITLNDLLDYNHPLLRKLQLLAPGTFHHAVMVATIAERAADDIRANALLCRCGALYHDIGKMPKPDYFIENQRQGANPHTDIAPSMSALVIKSHVREGLEIAREYHLPRVVINLIEQHHGTGLITFFFHKARKACAEAERPAAGMEAHPVPAPDSRAVDETLYRYDGPKPQTKEAAILLLADSVEAASRSLKKVTPQTVEELVDTIVTDRIEDGQLDECPLTFREVETLRGSLKKSLLNCLHQRVEYPGDAARPASKPPFGSTAPGATKSAAPDSVA